MQQPQLLFQAVKRDSIEVADAPLPLGGSIRRLSIAEFEAKFELAYAESCSVAPETTSQQRQLLTGAPLPPCFEVDDDELQRNVAKRLQQPLTDLVVCHISDEVGYGLFTRKPIAEGSVLMIYAGEVGSISLPRFHHNRYLYNLANCDQLTVNAQKWGNLARFMQHLPMDYQREKQRRRQLFTSNDYVVRLLRSQGHSVQASEIPMILQQKGLTEDYFIRMSDQSIELDRQKDKGLDAYQFQSSAVKDTVACANVDIILTRHHGYTVAAMIATDDIPAGAQLGYPYGQDYLQKTDKPVRLFDKQGRVIALDRYQSVANDAAPLQLFNREAHQKWVRANQGGIVRLALSREPYALGLFTTSINSCLGIVIQNSQRISLIHADFATDPECLKHEFAWVAAAQSDSDPDHADEPQISFFKNDDFINAMLRKRGLLDKKKSYDTEEHFLDELRRLKMMKKLKKRVKVPNGIVCVNRDGEFSFPEAAPAQVLPNQPLVQAILFVNGFYQQLEDKMHMPRQSNAYVEYANGRYMDLPELTPKAKFFINFLLVKLRSVGEKRMQVDGFWDLFCQTHQMMIDDGGELAALDANSVQNITRFVGMILKYLQDNPDLNVDSVASGHRATVAPETRRYPFYDVMMSLTQPVAVSVAKK